MRYFLTLDLKDDAKLIAEYEAHHKAVWPEIIESIKTSGITSMEIYRYHTRLFMLMETAESFTFEHKAALDEGNARVQEWETLMWKYQDPLQHAIKGEKWALMDKIFEL